MLDDVDRRLLRALQGDAGLSHVALAELAGSSPASCWRRIRALDEAVPEARRHAEREVTRLHRMTPEELERWRQQQAERGLVAVGGGVAPGGGSGSRGPGRGSAGGGRDRGSGDSGSGRGAGDGGVVPLRPGDDGVRPGGFREVAPSALNFGRGRSR